MESEDFQKKIIEILTDISYVSKKTKIKSDHYLQLLKCDNTLDKKVEYATLAIVTLMQQFSEILFPTLNCLEDIAKIKQEGQDVFYEELRSKLSQCKECISLLRPENNNIPGQSLNENSRDVKNNNRDQVSDGSSLLPTTTVDQPKNRGNLSLKKLRRSETPDTDDSWVDTLKRNDPNNGNFLKF